MSALDCPRVQGKAIRWLIEGLDLGLVTTKQETPMQAQLHQELRSIPGLAKVSLSSHLVPLL